MSKEKDVTSPHKGTAKVVKQSNHDGGRVPVELSEYADQPLYVLIALWGLQQKTWIGHKQVSTVFSITERRASFQLSYILRKTEVICCQTRKVKVQGTRRLCHQIKIENVILAGVVEKTDNSKSQAEIYQKRKDKCSEKNLHLTTQ
ncbi:CaiF/GrlA family transcriptional regulator [Erwiniaceae bacterium CAU 1747]